MKTEWKNTLNDMKKVIRENKKIVIGVVLVGVVLVILSLIYRSFYWSYYPSGQIWALGIVVNLIMMVANYMFVTSYLTIHYKRWIPENETFYDEWKHRWKIQQRGMAAGGFAAFVLAFAYYFTTDRMYYYGNFALGYVLLATVIIQYATANFLVIKFMRKKLSQLMECMTSINHNNLEDAIKIEKESMAKAAKSEQMKVDLISNVSHDLKTPLTSMVGYIELMKKEELTPTLSDYVEVMSDKAEKLKEMIESLFSIAKASSGNIELNMEPINMNMLIEQIFADMSDKIEGSDLSFVKLLSAEDTELVSDNIYMYRICQNLVENALKYSAAGTRVFIRTYVESGELKDKICLEITNTAGYFMDFNKDDIIERFARGDKARSSDGNGLGLAIVSTYASALGGTFDINIDCDQFKAMLSFTREA